MITRILLTLVLAGAVGPVALGGSVRGLFQGSGKLQPEGPIDTAVHRKLKAEGITPAPVCSDAVFLRRAYLDVIGTLPTAPEVTKFLGRTDPGKRSELIDELLERPEFADYWALRWSVMLRIKAEFPINLWPNAAQAYHRWVHTNLRDNKPYDQVAREMLTSSGSNFRVPPVNFYRAAQSTDANTLAVAVALTFMGERADKWKPERLEGLAGFFEHIGYKRTQEWKEEVVYFDSLKAAKSEAAGELKAAFPDGRPAKLSASRDPREVFADWLISPDNPRFARVIVNRIWYWLFGRGIVHPPDDFRPDNPPSNPELLDALARELVASKYDLKHVYRLILNSRTYQLSSVQAEKPPKAEEHFSCYAIRRLDAEVLIDALCQITGTTEQYESRIPEPFTWVPEDCRSIALPDGSITSSFLEMFGKPPRDTGLASERSNKFTAEQRLHLLNSSHVREKIERSPKLRPLMMLARKNPRRAVTGLYLAILSRFPTEDELKAVAAYARNEETKGRIALIDLTWALLNSSEFLYRH